MTNPQRIAEAKGAALKALAGCDHTRQEMQAHLIHKRFSPAVIEAAILELETMGLLDDRKVAESYVRSRLEQERTSRLDLEVTLEERGVDPGIVRTVLNAAFSERDENGDALELARLRVRTCPAKLSPDAVRRRVFAYLARRGYDDDTCRWAVETAAEEYLGRP
jgi:regulatory protein